MKKTYLIRFILLVALSITGISSYAGSDWYMNITNATSDEIIVSQHSSNCFHLVDLASPITIKSGASRNVHVEENNTVGHCKHEHDHAFQFTITSGEKQATTFQIGTNYHNNTGQYSYRYLSLVGDGGENPTLKSSSGMYSILREGPVMGFTYRGPFNISAVTVIKWGSSRWGLPR